MNWNFLISFGVGLGIYFIILGVLALVKRNKNKKLADTDKKKFESEDSNEVKDNNVNKE